MESYTQQMAHQNNNTHGLCTCRRNGWRFACNVYFQAQDQDSKFYGGTTGDACGTGSDFVVCVQGGLGNIICDFLTYFASCNIMAQELKNEGEI